MRYFYLFLVMVLSITLNAQNTYTAPATGDLVINDCNGILYDVGGPDSSYTDFNEAFITINGTSGDALALTFTEFDVEDHFDDLTIYDGPTTNSPLIGIFTGTALPNNGNPILLSGTSCLIVFDSDFTITGNGFAINFDCIDFTEPPVAAASYPGLSCSGTVAFADNSTFFPTSWTWDFGDGNTSTEQNPTHTYAQPGVYDIQLEVCNDNGCDTLSVSEAINFDPDSPACSNAFSMTLHGSETTTLCNGILYDNGGPDGDYAEGSSDQFIIAPPGATSITVTFTEFNLGDSPTNNDQLSLFGYDGTNYTPLGTFLGDDLPNNGQPITFQTPALALFFFSDHLDNFPGFAMAWEANGVSSPPSASFTANTVTVPFGTAVEFTDTSTGNPGAWSWDFGDGNTSNEQNPSYTYSEAGTFNVTLTVSNCSGADTSIPLVITVQDPPALTFDPESFTIELEAGTSATDLLNLCNTGVGDLIASLSLQDESNQTGYLIEFTTSAGGTNFGWQLFNDDFQVVVENSQTYEPNTTYTEVIDGLESGGFYYFRITGEPLDVNVFETITLTDLGTGSILFSGFFEFIPNQLYVFPSPFSGVGGIPQWLSLSQDNSSLAGASCDEIVVTFDATDLVEGVYLGSINIASNDPNQPWVNIPVTLIVNGTPELNISANDLDFGEVQVGASSTLSFTLANSGTAGVAVSGLETALAVFDLQSAETIALEPGESQTIEVTFTPDEQGPFTETLTLSNTAGDDLSVTLNGVGTAAPSLTINPTEFTVELIEGQDTTLFVDIGNIGEAVLDFSINTTSNNTGFIFNFTTDFWGAEFSWNLLDSEGNIVQSSAGISYQSNTSYTVELFGLLTDETYSLQLLDSWGDGALPAYSVIDALTGQIIVEGAFIGNIFEEIVVLGSPGVEFAEISPASGSVDEGNSTQLEIDLDATGLATGTYNLVYSLDTNDPLQPEATINVTLFVIAPVTAAIDGPSFICGTLPVQFTDESSNIPTSWSWDFGDGTTSTVQNPVHTYTESGVYTVTLEACNSLGCDVITVTDFIEVDVDCFAQNIPQHGNEIVTVCSGNLYDSGGPNGPYIEGSFGSITVAPPGATSVSITFSEFDYQEHADFLLVYDGVPGTGTLLGTFTGNDLEGQTLIATSGVLTIQENTDHFVNLSGFVATFTCSSTPPQRPKPQFSVESIEVCANEPVVFIDESLQLPTSWFWEFGDGGTSNEQNPIYFYPESGIYNVTLTACNAEGCNTIVQSIDLTIDPNCLIEDMPVNDQQILSGCFGTLYDSGGANENYVDNNTGITTIISPVGPITLEFVSFNYENGFDGLAIFDGPTTEDPLIGFFTGSGIPDAITSTGTAITILESTDFTDSESGFQINYSCQGALGDLTGSRIMVANDDMCDGIRSFMVNTNADVLSWNWDFGDGHSSTEANPGHTFEHSGIKSISVTICNTEDCETLQTMIYSNKLIAEISAPDTVAIGQEVQLHGLTAEATHWSWDFGNGEVSDHSAPVTTYTEAGWHDIHVHLINMDIHETCDAAHTHSLFVDGNLTSTSTTELLDFTVFPNPTTGEINLRGMENMGEDYEIHLRSVVGQVLLATPYAPSISIEQLPSGMYLLEIIDNNEIVGRKRVIKE